MARSLNLCHKLALTSLSLALAGTSATAEDGHRFHLVEGIQLEAADPTLVENLPDDEPLQAGFLRRAFEAESAPRPTLPKAPVTKSLAPKALEPGTPFRVTKEEETSGCRATPASPAIGADVPLTYFGVPSPTANPSLVGALQLLTSGVLDTEQRTITVPLYQGLIDDSDVPVWYIATDSTDADNALSLGINHSAKLAFGETLRGTRNATLDRDGLLIFEEGQVDFSPVRELVAGPEPNPFPPAIAQPGSIGDEFYSPLVKVLNAGGHIYNLPTVASGTEEQLLLPDATPNYGYVHDSVIAIDFEEETVTLELVAGFSFGRPVLYLSMDSNSAVAAALEGATLAPGLDDIDVGNDDSLFSAVERIFITVNGPRSCDNPQRQGLNAAVTDGEAPFNVLGGIPTIAGDYSPLWDANIGAWTQDAIDQGFRSRLIDEFQILSMVEFGFVTGPGGADYGSTGIIINCPIVHRFL